MGKSFRLTVFVLAALLGTRMPVAAQEAQRACKHNPKLVGDCFGLHGRLTMVNGGYPYRIWRVGTDRMLGLTDESSMPDWLLKKVNEDVKIFGDFEVCPLTKLRDGELQEVCIESATHLVVVKEAENKAATKR